MYLYVYIYMEREREFRRCSHVPPLVRKHLIRNENLNTISKTYLKDWEAVYNHTKNKKLRESGEDTTFLIQGRGVYYHVHKF